MADGPTLVVAIAAIALTLSPVSLNFIARLFATICRTIWPSLGQCEALGWDNIANGPLHRCKPSPNDCRHFDVPDSQQSWDCTIGSFFTYMQRGTFVTKPRQLDLSTTYVRTDKKTLRVLLSLLGHEGIKIEFQDVDGITTAHIQGSEHSFPRRQPPLGLDVTKREMELILRGYPPWYRDPLPLPDNRNVLHPIKEAGDVSKGGWVVALGFSRTNAATLDFLKYVEPVSTRSVYSREWVAVNAALDRVVYCFNKLNQAFPEDTDVKKGKNLMESVSPIRLGPPLSGLFLEFENSGLGPEDSDWFDSAGRPTIDFTQGMTESQITTAMEVFNRSRQLTDDEINTLRPVLHNVVLAAAAGVYNVAEQFYCYSREEEHWPRPKLEGDGPVYLRGNGLH